MVGWGDFPWHQRSRCWQKLSQCAFSVTVSWWGCFEHWNPSKSVDGVIIPWTPADRYFIQVDSILRGICSYLLRYKNFLSVVSMFVQFVLAVLYSRANLPNHSIKVAGLKHVGDAGQDWWAGNIWGNFCETREKWCLYTLQVSQL